MTKKETRFIQTLRILEILHFLKSWNNVHDILKHTRQKRYPVKAKRWNRVF